MTFASSELVGTRQKFKKVSPNAAPLVTKKAFQLPVIRATKDKDFAVMGIHHLGSPAAAQSHWAVFHHSPTGVGIIMEKALLKATNLLLKALAGDINAIAILVTLGFGYLLERGIKSLKSERQV